MHPSKVHNSSSQAIPAEKGLSTQQASSRLTEAGPNVLPERRRPGPLLIFIRQFKSPFIYVLFASVLDYSCLIKAHWAF
jgi:magnesium-transporting ATPase (P-type)